MGATISIRTVIDSINDTMDIEGAQTEFNLKARYTDGAAMGKIYFKSRVSKHLTGKFHERNDKDEEKSKLISKRNYENATLLLYDHIVKRTFSIPFWALIEFNGKKIIHE